MAAISFTKFHAIGVAKKYALVDGVATKTPAETFKTGSFETNSVSSMAELANFVEKRKPGDFITAGINQTQLIGKCGLGDGEIRRTKEDFPFATNKPGILIIDSDNLETLGITGRIIIEAHRISATGNKRKEVDPIPDTVIQHL